MADLIDRQAAIEAIKDFKQGAEEWREEQEERSDIWHRADSAVASALEIGLRIKKLPSAQPERKTGRWQYVDYGGFGNWHCTACRKICICNGDYDFCPNCGAKMNEEVRAWDD